MNNSRMGLSAAFDMPSMAALKRSPQGGLLAAARQIEGLFLNEVLKNISQGGIFDSEQSKLYTSMYHQQLSENLTAKGMFGLADMMVKQLGGEPEAGRAKDPTPLLPMGAAANPLPQSLSLLMQRAFPDQDTQRQPSRSTGPVMHNAGFISRLAGPAQRAARESGLPYHLIMAQAALESGWGTREIQTSDGKPSHNLFGIKAGESWKGESTTITTTEYFEGIARKVTATFRVYASYADALRDYTGLLVNNPRYRQVAAVKTPEQGAHALQAAGYATDPHYAQKLVNIIGQMKSLGQRVASAYQTDLGSLF
ncbi:flagellar assembly peptidoglycan hydrolase FlgJ [Biostraticola tofi]|uniref:Peptidoglycan hydrolase FlgJ n=1 Tax=Biostraticola tofi TaxID=466109 RepID=A0A4R3YRP9_9GAMM|nr:flagellar assembly peptidoglycan hydrolase FlgJ [Biostraticola tofi]TCV95547.1 flagellar protein FlgJ [Biostraticola tofi]